MKEDTLDAYIKKHKKVPLAAHYMLADWRQRQHNSRVAYSRLCEILETADVTFYIADALKVCRCHKGVARVPRGRGSNDGGG